MSPIAMFNWPLMRAIIWLKRCATSLASIADSQRSLVAIERERTPATRPIKKTEFTVASVAEWNKHYDEEHPSSPGENDGQPSP
jgi:hypothetical protein